MVFSWLRQQRRRRLLAQPFPDAWLAHLDRNMALYALLTEAERAWLQDDLRVFISEKNWEGCGGLPITDEMRVTIAAHACLLLLGLEHDDFRRVRSVLVYPTTYRDPHGYPDRYGLVPEGDCSRLGEAWYRGPVVLAWDAVLADGRDPAQGRSVVLHEFAHQLDHLDGLANGTPPLGSEEQYERWRGVMTAEYEKLVRDYQRGKATILDPYGTTNSAEFFAVATESFFTQPVPLRRRHPLLYQVLREFYGQDPAVRHG